MIAAPAGSMGDGISILIEIHLAVLYHPVPHVTLFTTGQ